MFLQCTLVRLTGLTVGGALGSQSSVPPTTPANEWSWETSPSGSTLIPGADTSSREGLDGGLFKKVPKAPEFNGTDVLYPSWSHTILLKARCHYNLVAVYF